jgi:hypothetical protein
MVEAIADKIAVHCRNRAQALSVARHLDEPLGFAAFLGAGWAMSVTGEVCAEAERRLTALLAGQNPFKWIGAGNEKG